MTNPPRFSPEVKRAALALIDPAADLIPQPAPVDVAEGRPDETALGQLIWHSSGEDEGPDVGISVGLGSDRFLYFGELATATLADHDIDVKETGDGWWLVFYGPTDADTRVVALAPDTYAARDFMDRMFSLTRALLSAAEERDAAKAESGASTKTLLSLPSGDYPVHANVAEAFDSLRSERDALKAEVGRLTGLLNNPETADFVQGVMREAPHQRQRWGSSHDAGKAPLDWFWLIGFLAQKAAASAMAGDAEKAQHHTISTAAALANWHAAISGADTTMRPGINPAELTAFRPEGDNVAEALRELHALVKGECPSLLDEDSGGNSRLAMEIEDALASLTKEGGE